MAITPRISANRLNMVDLLPKPVSYGLKPRIFKPREDSVPFRELPL